MKKITFLLLTILPLLGFSQVSNGTFDSDISPWVIQNGATLSHSSTEGHNALGAMQIAAAGTNTSGAKTPNSAPSDGAGEYVFSCWVKGNAGEEIRLDAFQGSFIGGTVQSITSTGVWEYFEETFTLTSANVNLRIIVRTPSATLLVDDVAFTYVPPAGNTLTVNAVGGGTVTKSPDQVSYQPTDNVTLTANPKTHWNFDSWSGDLTGTINPETLLMDTDKTVTATFTIDPTFDYAFTFDTDNDLEGWDTTDGQVSLSGPTGGLVTVSVTADQWARFNLQGFPIPSGTYNKVTITLKNETTNDELGFAVVDGSNVNETITQAMTTNDTSVQTYEFDLTQYVNWTGDVNYVRIRFADVDNTTNVARPLVSGNIIIDDVVFSYDPTLSAKDVSKKPFGIFPNPTNGIVNLVYQGSVNKVEVFDITGKQVLSTNGFTNRTQLNLSNLKNGVYLIKLNNKDSNSVIKKLVIQ